jgi:hypothetical protein
MKNAEVDGNCKSTDKTRTMRRPVGPKTQGNRLVQRRVGPARFERRPTIMRRRELLVGRRGEASLVPPYNLPSFKKALALAQKRTRLSRIIHS